MSAPNVICIATATIPFRWTCPKPAIAIAPRTAPMPNAASRPLYPLASLWKTSRAKTGRNVTSGIAQKLPTKERTINPRSGFESRAARSPVFRLSITRSGFASPFSNAPRFKARSAAMTARKEMPFKPKQAAAPSL